ncbi:MAG TPA: hypothetical protein ENK88_03435 [Campylobacterales bacterium]|nr:hypothetical protein [Campylobacterales bacterium]HHH50770.1 hypothetical protein [Campylobacterales bacterium]
MACTKTAVVRMEEGYMRLTIQYNDPTYKSEICKDIAGLEQKLDIYPEVIYRKDSVDKWSCSIEFSGDEYICSRTCGEFIETLIHDLGINECERD